MKVLIGCEESQVVCKAFRLYGHDAYSCDILPTRGNPDWHIWGDIVDVIPKYGPWNLIILHPDCTAMALSGNRWYGIGMQYHIKRMESIIWTIDLWNLATDHSPKVVLENPASVIFKHLTNAVIQYIQPWQFGHPETKKTGLALHNLPKLKPTEIVEGREQRVWKMAPSTTRKRDRSETYLGIALAMVQQWGG